MKLNLVSNAQQEVVLRHQGISKQDVSRWISQENELKAARANGDGQKRKVVISSCVCYPTEEDELYIRFTYRREVQGLPVTDDWLQCNPCSCHNTPKPNFVDSLRIGTFADVLDEFTPDERCKTFQCSNGNPSIFTHFLPVFF